MSLTLLLVACTSNAPGTGAECTEDTACSGGQICHESACLLPARLKCLEGDGTAPKAAIDKAALDFGDVQNAPVSMTITVENQGDCSLDFLTATLTEGASSGFRCNDCNNALFPMVVYPGRSVAIEVEALAGAPGQIMDTLQLMTSDPALPSASIPLVAQRAGVPALVVTPIEIDFGFVPVGRSKEAVVQAINATDGQVELTILGAAILGPDQAAFTVEPAIDQPVRLGPALLDPAERLALLVRYTPMAEAAHQAELVVTPESQAQIRVALSALGQPPAVTFSPDRVDFGAVPLGETRALRVTLQNVGQAPLEAQNRFLGAGLDLSFPSDLPAKLEPGRLFELNVLYTPTVVGMISDAIVIESNDPQNGIINIPIAAVGQLNPNSTQVIALEFTFENGSDTPLDHDLREANLILESPNGLIVDEDNPMAVWGGQGTARWSASGPRRNPERILLTDATEDGRYPVLLSYLEDCSTLPTALAAALVGVGTDELVDYLSEGEVQLDETQVAAAIEQACVNRRSTDATVTVTIDGQLVDTIMTRLPEKGALVPALTLVREMGQFSVER